MISREKIVQRRKLLNRTLALILVLEMEFAMEDTFAYVILDGKEKIALLKSALIIATMQAIALTRNVSVLKLEQENTARNSNAQTNAQATVNAMKENVNVRQDFQEPTAQPQLAKTIVMEMEFVRLQNAFAKMSSLEKLVQSRNVQRIALEMESVRKGNANATKDIWGLTVVRRLVLLIVKEFVSMEFVLAVRVE